tara:strand:- start:274 stop:432 length:159 start_codon:yes stop_codon:yes gene_type:complete
MNKDIKKVILAISDWNKDGKTQWWEPLLSILFLLIFWLGFVGAVVVAMWLTK